MKRERGGFRTPRHEQLFQELVHDSYHSKRKLPEPALCPDCGAVYRRGRWSWGRAPAGAREARCPACRRVRDRFPAGYVSLAGKFFDRHRDEILHRVRRCEGIERADHPLERIMGVERERGRTVVTTTDAHLARRIGVALHKTYKGELEIRYNTEDNLLRVSWSR
jgi:hypothetical protein